MARANRHHLPGYVWHITHRCHKKESLLKFGRDRSNWLRWLFEAKKRYGLKILNYAVTSNHIHLLVLDDLENVIPKSLQLVAGRTAQEYNLRKKRKGAFWEDRYHATAIDSSTHLFQCMVYINLNMVRAGVVDEPSKWGHCGYKEIMNPPKRYHLISQSELQVFSGTSDWNKFRIFYKKLYDDALKNESQKRECPVQTVHRVRVVVGRIFLENH